MIKNFFQQLRKRRHFWRFADFSEIAELYIARLMRTVAFNLGAAFISVFMLKVGYSIVTVALFWAAYFAFKVVISLPLAQVIAYIGAKKAILISNFLYVPSMVALIFLPEVGWPALLVTGLFQSTSATLYDIGYLVNFSRIKTPDKAGREVAFMNIIEKIAKSISPLIGGLLAMFFDPRITIIASIFFFILAAWPMMNAKDTMTKGFQLAPRHFPWRMAIGSLTLQLPIGFDTFASTNAWSIFLVSLILTASGNQAYAELGAITSIVLLVSLASTYLYGKIIDKKAGETLLFWTAVGNSVIHLLRAFVRTPVMAVGTNAAKEVVGTGYSMAFMRGMFDVADRSKYRVFYIGASELMSSLGSAIAAILLALIVIALDATNGFILFYLLTAGIVISASLAKFKIYS